MPLEAFLRELWGNPALMAVSALTLAVILVNGWTDAPNAIATCVSTRAMGVRPAIVMAAVCNFLGALVMTAVNANVAMTIYNIVDFGGDARQALIALCAAMAAIVTWATAAWALGIPTSESHALVAGLTGAAIGIRGSLAGVNGDAWLKVLEGLALSTALGFALGFCCLKLTERLLRGCDRRRARRPLVCAQIGGGAAMAFMHGAQDGQKFMAVFLLGAALARGDAASAAFSIPLWLIALCSLVMALGTSIGGYRIIKSVGMDMVKLTLHQGFAADLAGALCLLISTLLGAPVSTTHTKTCAIMGVGAARRLRSVNASVVKDLALAWLLTFPGCGLIGLVFSRIFLAIFS